MIHNHPHKEGPCPFSALPPWMISSLLTASSATETLMPAVTFPSLHRRTRPPQHNLRNRTMGSISQNPFSRGLRKEEAPCLPSFQKPSSIPISSPSRKAKPISSPVVHYGCCRAFCWSGSSILTGRLASALVFRPFHLSSQIPKSLKQGQ